VDELLLKRKAAALEISKFVKKHIKTSFYSSVNKNIVLLNANPHLHKTLTVWSQRKKTQLNTLELGFVESITNQHVKKVLTYLVKAKLNSVLDYNYMLQVIFEQNRLIQKFGVDASPKG